MAAETKIVIAHIKPYDGEYEFDMEQALSAKEWRWMKKISEGDIKPGEINLSDPDLVISFAVIAMQRAGKITKEQVLDVADFLSDAPLDDAHIHLVIGEEDEEEIPPELTVEPERSSENGSAENEQRTNVSSLIDGSTSKSGSDLLARNRAATGATK